MLSFFSNNKQHPVIFSAIFENFFYFWKKGRSISGLPLKARVWGFPLAIISMTPGYFHGKRRENR